MPERSGPQVYSIAAHRGFADALVAGLVPRYAEPELGLARLTLLLPSQRAVRTVTEAFVRLAEGGMLLPRMAVVGDLDLDETLGPLLDPLLDGADIPPAADPERLNATLRRVETELLSHEGLPGRPWYRHTIYAPGEYTGYAAVVIPGVNEAIDTHDIPRATLQLAILSQALDRAAQTLGSIP